MTFQFLKTTKNYHKYQQVGGINVLYIPLADMSTPIQTFTITGIPTNA